MAIELTDANAIFYEIPKTGTNFVRRVLATLKIPYEDLHPYAHVDQKHSLPEHYPTRRYSFAAVRHPLSWYVSYWRYALNRNSKFLNRPNWDDRWYPYRPAEPVTEHQTFNEWVRAFTRRQPAYVTRLYEAYIGPFNYQRITRVIRQETLRDDLVSVLTELKYDFDPAVVLNAPKENQSPATPIRWEKSTYERTEELERAAIVRWYPEINP